MIQKRIGHPLKHRPRFEFIRKLDTHKTETPSKLNRYLGCMIGGAVGDAIGASVEFNVFGSYPSNLWQRRD